MRETPQRRSRFFVVMAVVPLVVGFAVLHGVVLTIWFGLLLAQTLQIAARRTALNRRVGVATAGFAIVMTLFLILGAGSVHRLIGPRPLGDFACAFCLPAIP